MKYYLTQLNPIVGDLEGNKIKILLHVEKAKKEKCSIIIFPELAICGYPPDDLLDYPYFIDKCINTVEEIAKRALNITVIVGGISRNNSGVGRKLFNTAFVLQNGKIYKKIHKTLLPTYDIFTERRYFEPNNTFELVDIEGKQIAISICEDIWDRHNDFNYAVSPVEELTKLKPDIHINICASPYHQNKFKERETVIKDCIKRMECPLIYLNQAAANTGILFDGDSGAYNVKGEKVLDMPLFEEAAVIFDGDASATAITNHNYDTDIAVVHKALVFGIKSYFEKMGFKKWAVLGSSGGVDSALVQALSSEALGAENVLAVLMPSSFSSEESISDAAQLSKNLGNPYQVLPIADAFDTLTSTLLPIFKNTPFGVAEENIQARTRGLLLMAISNKTGRFLLNTSNKSEMAVGYTTLYGDMCGGLCPIGDVYKMQIYELCKYINREKEIIPLSILNKAPSAELRPNQKDSDSLPDYDVLDKILQYYIEERLNKEAIINKGFDTNEVTRIIDLVNRNEYKRWQAAPIIKISSKDFSYGRKMPLVAKYF